MSKNTILDREATVNGIRIHYKIAGSGNPLLLLHGSPLTSRSWLGIMPALAKSHTVIAPDFRGSGQSEKREHGYEVQTGRFYQLGFPRGHERIGRGFGGRSSDH